MTYQGEQKIPLCQFNNSGPTTEYIARRMVHAIIDTVTFEDLEYVFGIEIIDPRSDEFKKKLRVLYEKDKDDEIDYLLSIKSQEIVVIKARLILNYSHVTK